MDDLRISNDTFKKDKLKNIIYKEFKKSKLNISKIFKDKNEPVVIVNVKGDIVYKNYAATKTLNAKYNKNIFQLLNIDFNNDSFLKDINVKIKGVDKKFNLYSHIINEKNDILGYLLIFEEIKEKELKTIKDVELMYSNSKFGCYIEDEQSNILYANKILCESLKIDNKAEIYSKGIKNYVLNYKDFKNISRSLIGFEFKFYLNNGDLKVWLIKDVRFIKKFKMVVIDDITENFKNKNEYMQLERNYYNLFNSIPTMVVIVDMEGNIKLTNKAFRDFMGAIYSGSKVNLSSFISDDFEKISSFLKNQENSIEISFIKDNKKYTTICYKTPQYDASGNIDGYLLSFSDITFIKEYYVSIEKNFEIIDNIFNSLNEGILILDLNLNILKINKRLEEILGYNAQEIIKNGIGILFKDTMRFSFFKDNLKEAESMMFVKNFEFPLIRKDGIEIFTRISVNLSNINDNRIFIISISDITETIEHKKNLEEKEKKIKHSQKMEEISILVSGIAHDLNNPLANIYGFAHLLLNDLTLTTEARESIEMIVKSSEQAKHIVENFLKFVRKENKNKEKFSIKDVIDSVVLLTNYILKKSKIKVKTEMEDNLFCYGVFGDIQQVFYNLFINAIDAMEDLPIDNKEIVITIKSINDYIRIDFFNTGKTIPLDLKDKIFEPFFTTKDNGKGTGLGLSISKQIIIEHNGDMYVDTNEKKGARFVIIIPQYKVSIRIENKKEGFIKKTKGKRILVIDDDRFFSSFIQKILKDNYIDIAYSISQAKLKLSSSSYDLVISDLNLEDGDGIEFYKNIKAHIKTPFIFVTGDILRKDDFDYLEKNNIISLKKPITKDELLCAISKVL